LTAFAPFAAAMSAPSAPQEPEAIAQLLHDHVVKACADANLSGDDIYCTGNLVTMLFTRMSAWEAVCVASDAYQFYPGFVMDEGERIVWPNIWIAADLSLATFISELEGAFAEACAGKTAD
jgi:hypothetical protein